MVLVIVFEESAYCFLNLIMYLLSKRNLIFSIYHFLFLFPFYIFGYVHYCEMVRRYDFNEFWVHKGRQMNAVSGAPSELTTKES